MTARAPCRSRASSTKTWAVLEKIQTWPFSTVGIPRWRDGCRRRELPLRRAGRRVERRDGPSELGNEHQVSRDHDLLGEVGSARQRHPPLLGTGLRVHRDEIDGDVAPVDVSEGGDHAVAGGVVAGATDDVTVGVDLPAHRSVRGVEPAERRPDDHHVSREGRTVARRRHPARPSHLAAVTIERGDIGIDRPIVVRHRAKEDHLVADDDGAVRHERRAAVGPPQPRHSGGRWRAARRRAS